MAEEGWKSQSARSTSASELPDDDCRLHGKGLAGVLTPSWLPQQLLPPAPPSEVHTSESWQLLRGFSGARSSCLGTLPDTSLGALPHSDMQVLPGIRLGTVGVCRPGEAEAAHGWPRSASVCEATSTTRPLMSGHEAWEGFRASSCSRGRRRKY